MTRCSLVFIAVLSALTVPTVTRAQQTPPPRVRREIPGFDFRKDGVWRRQARAVRAVRARLLSRRNFGALNAPMAAAGAPLASGAAMSGVLRVPAILFKFKDTPAAQLRTTTQYNQVLFAASPTGASAGRPYTYRTYYEQLSNGLFSVQGNTYGSVALDSNEITYAGSPPCPGNPYGTGNCNGFWSGDAFTRMQSGLQETLRKLDSQVDWRQYDADGDGYVDLVVFLQPELDGSCVSPTNNHIWAHRSALQPVYVTHSKSNLGVNIKVADYVVQSAVGGDVGCDASQIMPISTVVHETGHGLGLPDLYDTDLKSEGVGEFSVMASGNYTSELSPARMDAWSLNELGWVTLVPLTTPGTYSFGPAPTADTAFFLPVVGANPRGEYFLLENRQAVQSDSAMIRFHCQVWYNSTPPPSCGGGLLTYHVDSAQMVAGVTTPGPNNDFNHVNVGPIHGLAVVQADGRGNLDADPNTACSGAGPACSDRGDAGDLYPGPTANVAFSPTTLPAALRNSDGMPAGLVIDQITQLVPNGTMQFRLSYPIWVVRATDSAAVIQFDGLPYHLFRAFLTANSVHSVSVADTQFTAGGRTRQVFGSWSGGQPRSFSYMASATPETLTVTLARSHQVHYSATSGGTITGSVPSDTFVTDGTQVTLTAADTSALRTFQGWAGDTVTKNLSITLPMNRPYAVRAVFLEPFSTAAVVAQLLNGTSTLTVAQLDDLDQLGNNNGRFDLGDFLAWVQATGAPLTAEQRALVSALKRTGVSR